MISSAISADLGRQDALRGSQEALATVTGIVDGTGSIGAAGGQVSRNTGHFTILYKICSKNSRVAKHKIKLQTKGHKHLFLTCPTSFKIEPVC